MEFLKRNWVNLWQVAYILLATSWLFAPAVNDIVSSQATSISQFLIPGMPYAWLFRACEFIAAILLLLVIVRLYVKSKKVTLPILLLSIIGFGALADLIVPTTCQIVDGVCQQTASGQVIIHGLETAIVAAALFALTAWDAWKNKRIPSQVFLITQATVGLLLISSWANAHDLTTLLQFFYQGCAVIWIAWFVAGELQGNYRTYKLRQSWVNTTLALWVSLQGLATILIGSLHFELFEGLFTESQAMLFASHSMIVGVIFLYLGRQLMRGERRAWQLLVVLLGLEVIKYSVLLPQPLLLGFYMLTLISTLVSKDFFNRGVVHQTWRSKTYDVVIIASAVIVAMAIIAYLLSYTSVYSHTTAHPHMITLLIIAAVLFMFWAMFRPTPDTKGLASIQEIEQAKAVLEAASNSTEDFFKLWPEDKEYFWPQHGDGFVAYKVVGPIAFALADPVAANGPARRRLLDQFVAFCQERDWRACFLLVDEASLPLYKKAGLGTMRIGASALVNIEQYVSKTAHNKWWRWQHNKGRKMNYQYEVASPPHAYALMQSLREVSDGWLQRGGHQEESFALGYFNTEYLQRCRIHLLKNESSEVVAFVNEIPLFNAPNQTTIDLIRFTEDAPHANIYLLYCLLHYLEEEAKYQFFDIGFVPLARMEGKVAKIARTVAANRFSAAGLEQFKNKFEPDWRKDYIAYDGDLGDLALIALNLEKAMAIDPRDLGK